METGDKVKVKKGLDGWRSEHEGERGYIRREAAEADWLVSLRNQRGYFYTNATFDEDQLEEG